MSHSNHRNIRRVMRRYRPLFGSHVGQTVTRTVTRDSSGVVITYSRGERSSRGNNNIGESSLGAIGVAQEGWETIEFQEVNIDIDGLEKLVKDLTDEVVEVTRNNLRELQEFKSRLTSALDDLSNKIAMNDEEELEPELLGQTEENGPPAAPLPKDDEYIEEQMKDLTLEERQGQPEDQP